MATVADRHHRNGTAAEVQKKGRDLRIDIFRGLALLAIFIDHMPGNSLAGLTPQRFGFSDAAEIFVLLAGVSATWAYGAIWTSAGWLPAIRAVLRRIATLYVVHLALIAAMLVLALLAMRTFGDQRYLDDLSLDALLTDPASAVRHALTLTYLPLYLDILPLYVVLLAAMPMIIFGLRLHWAAPLAVSLLLYAVAITTSVNLPNWHAGSVWYFNPLAWQIVFVAGATLAHVARGGVSLSPASPAGRALTVLAAGYLGFAFLVAAPWQQVPAFANLSIIPASALPVVSKTDLSPFRLLDVLARLWIVLVLVDRSAAILRSGTGEALALLGRHSLPVFAVGIVLSFVGSVALRELGFGLWLQIAVTIGGAGLMLALARWLESRVATVRRPAALVPDARGRAVA